MSAHTSHGGVQASHSLPVSPSGPPTSQEAPPPLTRPQEGGTKSSPFSSERPPDLIALLAFLLDSVWIFLADLVIEESFC